jgi:hypothetical protein
MPFITDIDLLRLEPALFTQAAGQDTLLLSAGDGVISGSTLSSAGSDFAAAGIDEGHVILAGAEALEVDERSSATALLVSRPRKDSTHSRIAPAAGTGLAITVRTFARAIGRAQAAMLAALGRGSEDELIEESMIVNDDAVAAWLAQQVAAQILAAASAAEPADAALSAMAAFHQRQARSATHRAVIELDLDGDGEMDAVRRLDSVAFVRT